jgi:transcriptional regulator with XRE-family HTH domain
MARLNDEQRANILAEFHAGKSQNELAKRYEVSPATINKLCKGIEPKHVEKVNALTRINTELAGESEYEVNAIHREVQERTKHIQFFTNAAIKNVQESMKEPCANQNDFRARAETILKGREAVLGKTPETAIQINNNAAPTTPHECSDDELAAIANGQ